MSDEFYTPLKKLPNKPVNFEDLGINNIPEIKKPEVEKESAQNLIPIDKITRLKKYHQPDLFTQTNPKPSIYYKPISTTIDSRFGIKPLVKPKVSFTPKSRVLSENHLNSESTESTETPGEWINPYMKQALLRQTNKEQITKDIMRSILYILGVKLVERVIKHYYDITHLIQLLVIGLIINITLQGSKLFKQDQCLDLPLNNKQRLLIGLKPLDIDISVPKHVEYSKY